MNISPSEILEGLKLGHYSNRTVIELFLYIIEKSKNLEKRIHYLHFLEKLELLNERCNDFLEDLVISDPNSEIRKLC